jgi:tetratricopeptide (TPR) repeat protein
MISNLQILMQKGNYKQLLESLEKIHIQNEKDLECLFFLGRVHYQLNNPKESLFFFKKYNQLRPNNILILFNIAMILQNLGKVKESEKIYGKIINQSPNEVRAYYGLFTLNEKNIDEDLIKKLVDLNSKDKISLSDKSLINFILSKVQQKKGHIDNEIKFLKISHQQAYEGNLNYNKQSDFYYNEIIPKYFNKINFLEKNFQYEELNFTNMIFIIGLPRSGSTFIESILSQSSNEIKSFGEFHGINMSIFDQIAEKIYSSKFKLKEFNLEIDKNFFQKSLKNKFLFKNNQVIIDKSLENIFNIEIILQFFPNAKFIHTFRNYEDSVIAIYQSMLSELSWAHDIISIKKYINNYKKVIEFFKTRYPDKILDLDIEKLTNSKESEAKKVFEFCNLVWDKKYLNYYNNNKLFSKTLSFKQIRSKIDKYDDNKYKKYYHLI